MAGHPFGFPCPHCDAPKTRLIGNAARGDGSRTHRRSCEACGARFTTREALVPAKLPRPARRARRLHGVAVPDVGTAMRVARHFIELGEHLLAAKREA